MVNNLVAKVPGTSPAGAVLMVAHYDSVPSGPGAGDNAASVAAILETMRALKAGPALRNDLIILFTDGEELGRLGAKGFVETYPALHNLRVVLNFAMRGDAGPSTMYQPPAQDWWLIDRLAAAGPYPRRTALLPLLFPPPPGETDLDIFLGAGLDGMTFGVLRGITRYQTELDNVGLLDQRALQDQGMRALSMAQRFGTIDLNALPTQGAAYSVRDRFMALPDPARLPRAARGARHNLDGNPRGPIQRSRASPRDLRSTQLHSQSRSSRRASCGICWRRLRAGGCCRWGRPTAAFTFSVGAIALVFATLWALYELISRSIRLSDLGAGALLAWTVMTLGTSIAMPSGSHPFLWPLLFAAVALYFGADPATEGRVAIRRAILAIVAIAPAIVALAPSFAGSTNGTMLLFVYAGLAGGFLFGWFIPYIDFLSAGRRWIMPAAIGLFAIVMFVIGSVASSFNASKPHPDSIFYFLDTDAGMRDGSAWIHGPTISPRNFFSIMCAADGCRNSPDLQPETRRTRT